MAAEAAGERVTSVQDVRTSNARRSLDGESFTGSIDETAGAVSSATCVSLGAGSTVGVDRHDAAGLGPSARSTASRRRGAHALTAAPAVDVPTSPVDSLTGLSVPPTAIPGRFYDEGSKVSPLGEGAPGGASPEALVRYVKSAYKDRPQSHLYGVEKLRRFGLRGEALEREYWEGRRLNTIRQFELQEAARYLLPDFGNLQGCLFCMQRQAECVELIHKPDCMGSRFGGLQTCQSVWVCPFCAGKITERRREELRVGFDAWRAAGGSLLFVTWTQRHLIGDGLEQLLDGMCEARRYATSGTHGKRIRTKYNIAGSVRSLEVTWGRNGWHPHYHEVLFIDGQVTPKMVSQLEADLFTVWGRGLDREGLRSVTRDHGVRVELPKDEDRIRDYIAKFGIEPERSWGVAEELTMWKVKASKGMAPFDLLSSFAYSGDMQHGERFQEYARAFKGRRQLYWSKGLKAKCGIDEVSDQEIAEDREGAELVLVQVARLHWYKIKKAGPGVRGDLKNAMNRGDAAEVWRIVSELRPTSEDVVRSAFWMTSGDMIVSRLLVPV